MRLHSRWILNTLAGLALLASLLGAYLASPAPARAIVGSTLHVIPSGGATTGPCTASNWSDACDLQTALGLAVAGDQIWVATGVYKPGPSGSQTATFNIPAGVALYGGFTSGQTQLSDRNSSPTTNGTVLSGDIDGNDTLTGYGATNGYTNNTGFNSYHVVTMDGSTTAITDTTVLDGFTVSGGNAMAGAPVLDGGGLYCYAGTGTCSPTLTNLWLMGNKAASNGGAVANEASSGTASPTFTDVTFQSNAATQGGSVYNKATSGGTSSPSFDSGAFYSGQAVRGGAVYNDAQGGTVSPEFTWVLFQSNNTVYPSVGGTVYNLATAGGTSSPSFTDLTFNNNGSATAIDGGAIYNKGDGGTASPSFSQVTFSGNHVGSGDGGAIYNTALNGGTTSPVFTNSTLYGNYTSSGDGGAMANFADGTGGSSTFVPSFTNVTFNNNTASSGNGGAVYNETTNSGIGGGLFTNAIMWGDSAASGNEIYSTGIFAPTMGILGIVAAGGCSGIQASSPGAVCAIEYTGDPKLGALQDNGGGTNTMALGPGSSAINTGYDAGCPGSDQHGVARPQGPHCDIGAYEFEKPAPPIADFDGGGTSDTVIFSGGAWQFYDFATGAYLPGSSVWTGDPGGCTPAPMDYDGDGSTEFTLLCGPVWHFFNADGGYNKGIWTGLASAVPVPGDYNADGVDDPVVFDGGAWQHYDFATGAYDAAHSVWTGFPGGAGTPAAMDYDGNGTADPTILDNTGAWHFYNDNGGYNKGIWTGGIVGDIPVPADYNGNGTEQPVVFSGGAWQFFDFATGAYDGASSVWTGAPAASGSGVVGPAPLDYNGDSMLDFTYYAGGAWHFFNADGGYNKGIWTGGTAGDEAISRRQLP